MDLLASLAATACQFDLLTVRFREVRPAPQSWSERGSREDGSNHDRDFANSAVWFRKRDHPALIAAPIIVFAALALWSHSRTAWLATAAWVVYLGYKLGMNAALLCSGNECMKRTPLYVVYPLLAFLSLGALVQVYVHIRDKRDRRRLATRRPTPTA